MKTELERYLEALAGEYTSGVNGDLDEFGRVFGIVEIYWDDAERAASEYHLDIADAVHGLYWFEKSGYGVVTVQYLATEGDVREAEARNMELLKAYDEFCSEIA